MQRIRATKTKIPYGTLTNPKLLSELLRSLATSLGWHDLEDYHGFTKTILSSVSPRLGNESPIAVLRRAFPLHEWKPFLMAKCPGGFWKNLENRRYFLKWFEKQMGLTRPQDWYSVALDDLYTHRGTTLVDFYASHPIIAAQELYPGFDFKPWLFQRMPKGVVSDKNLGRKFLEEEVEPMLLIDKPESWLEVTTAEKNSVIGLSKFCTEYGSIWKFLEAVKPEVDWRAILALDINNKRMQKRLFQIISTLYPQDDVRYDYWCPDLKFKRSKRSPQIDVYLIDREVGFEYQGGYHKHATVRARDRQKASLLKKAGITLIIVPEKWNGSDSTLREISEKQGLRLPRTFSDIKTIREARVPDSYALRVNTYVRFVSHFNCQPVVGDRFDGIDVGAWVNTQRTQRRHGTLSKERANLLSEVGFVFEPRLSWAYRVEGVIRFKIATGRWPYSKEHVDKEPVGTWIASIRRRAFFGKLDSESTKKLNALDFDWGRNASFIVNCDRLEKFLILFGRLPKYSELFNNAPLGQWFWRNLIHLERLKCESIYKFLSVLDGYSLKVLNT